MAIELYTRKPRGQKLPVTKYRVRIRTTVENLMGADGERQPYVVDERYDTLIDAERAQKEHWLAIRDGVASKALVATLARATEPTLRELLQEYANAEVPKRAQSSQAVERLRLEKTIPEVVINFGRKAENFVRPGYVAKDDHLVKRHYADNATISAAKALREGRSLTPQELAAISGHSDIAMVSRYANLQPEDLAALTNQAETSRVTASTEIAQPGVGTPVATTSPIRVRPENGHFVASMDTKEGPLEAVGTTAKEARQLLQSMI